MKKMVLNERLLRKTQEFIRAYPKWRAHSLDVWVCFIQAKEQDKTLPDFVPNSLGICGLTLGNVEQQAAKLLKIEYNNNRNNTESELLFYASWFPGEWLNMIRAAQGDEYTNVYCEWIDEFIRMKQEGTFPPSTGLEPTKEGSYCLVDFAPDEGLLVRALRFCFGWIFRPSGEPDMATE
jgi:hypothetical protein